MSRIGKKPITIPAGVTVTLHAGKIDFDGKKGKLSSPLQPGITAALEGTSLVIVSTSRGVMTGRACEELGTGGEVLCSIW